MDKHWSKSVGWFGIWGVHDLDAPQSPKAQVEILMVLGTLFSSPKPPTARNAFYGAAPKPSQAGQDNLPICP